MRNLTFAVVFSLGLLFYLPSSSFAAATMNDFWQGKAEWKLVNKITIGETGWDYGFQAGAHITPVGNTWYLFGRKYWPKGGVNCAGAAAPSGTVVRKSTDQGKTWSEPVDIVIPSPGTEWECEGTDGDAFYNPDENKWHYLFQCLKSGGAWNGCHLERSGSDPMGPFQASYPNPVFYAKSLWEKICDKPSDDCVKLSGGIKRVFDEGTFNIFDYKNGYYYVDFHGVDGVFAYRGAAKTSDFVNWVAGDASQGVPSDAILDRNDALNFRESWQGSGPIGFGGGSILSEQPYYYLISEAPDFSLGCTDGQNWDWGLFRSTSLTNTNWEAFPLGNPILYSSKKPERNGKSIGCNPAYARIFKDPGSQKIFMHTSWESTNSSDTGIYLYELTPSANLLQNGNLWKCSSEHWQKISPGANTTNMVALRFPHESSDANCFLSFNCGGTGCDPGQSIYQDADVSNIPYRKLAYGGKFASEGGSGSLLMSLFEFDSSGNIINETKTEISVGAEYRLSSNQIFLKDNTKKVRFQVYLSSNNGFKADEMFVEPVSEFSSSSPVYSPNPSPSTPRIIQILFNGSLSPETAVSLDLYGTAWSSFTLSNKIGQNIYSASADVTVSSGNIQVTRNLKINFILSPDASPKPPPRAFEIGIEAGEQHDTGRVGLVAETGAKWVRLNFVGQNWAADSNDVIKYNNIINAYTNQNIKIIGLIGAQSVLGGYDRSDPASFTQKFTQVAGDIIDRFGDRVKVYELFNEPNDWAGGTSSQVPERYFAQYLAGIYRKVKIEKQRGEIQLNSGPLLSHDQNSGASYLQETFNQGRSLGGNLNWDMIKNQTGFYPLDGVGYHIYVAQGMGDQAQVESKVRGNIDTVNAVINIFDPGKKLWITEIGWGTGAGRISEEVQSANLEKAYAVMGNHPAVKLGMWFTLIDFDSSQWGLIRANGTKKQAWESFKRLTTIVPSPSPSVSPSPSFSPTSSPNPSPSLSPSLAPAPNPTPSTVAQEETPSFPDNPDADISPPAPRRSQGPEVRVILVASQPIDPSGQSLIAIQLPGQTGKSISVLVPVAISYTEGAARNLAIQFNYRGTSGVRVERPQAYARVESPQGLPSGTFANSKFDLNGDKFINSVDVTMFFNSWRAKLKGGSIVKEDFNGDGVINSIDYAMLKNQIGKLSG